MRIGCHSSWNGDVGEQAKTGRGPPFAPVNVYEPGLTARHKVSLFTGWRLLCTWRSLNAVVDALNSGEFDSI